MHHDEAVEQAGGNISIRVFAIGASGFLRRDAIERMLRNGLDMTGFYSVNIDCRRSEPSESVTGEP